MKIEMLSKPDSDWDKRVLENNGSFFQTTSFAKYFKYCEGMDSFYLLVKNKSKIVGQLMISHGPKFGPFLKNKNSFVYKILSRYFRIYRFMQGPVIMDKKQNKKIISAFINFLEKEVKKKGFAIEDCSLDIRNSKKMNNLLLKKGFKIDDWGTYIIETKLPEEELRKNLQRRRRKSIRKMEKQNLLIKEAKSEEDYEKVIKIIHEMEERNKVVKHPKEYYLEFFNKIEKEEKLTKTFYVEKDGKGLAMMTIYIFNKKIAQAIIAHSNFSIEEKISAPDLLGWFIIKWAHGNNYEYYDLAGMRPDSEDPKEVGIREYKRSWGGEEILYPYFSKRYSRTKNILINIVLLFKKIIRRFI